MAKQDDNGKMKIFSFQKLLKLKFWLKNLLKVTKKTKIVYQSVHTQTYSAEFDLHLTEYRGSCCSIRRASALRAGGRWFDPWSRHTTDNIKVVPVVLLPGDQHVHHYSANEKSHLL